MDDEALAAEPAPAEQQAQPRTYPRLPRPELPPGMSRKQFKKNIREEKWAAGKGERRQKKRQKTKEKKRASKRLRAANGEAVPVLQQPRLMSDPCASPLRVAVDLQFEEYMTLPEMRKVAAQLRFSYSVNRRLPSPIQFNITSISGKIEEELSLASSSGLDRWDVHRHTVPYWEAFKTKDIVYLSSESDNVLMDVDLSKVYVIGGIVDHNRHKGLTHRLAVERGIAHAQLPIGQFLAMQSRKVLTINHVFEIMARFVTSRNWEEAFLQVLPERKGAKPLALDSAAAVAAVAADDGGLAASEDEQQASYEAANDADVAAAQAQSDAAELYHGVGVDGASSESSSDDDDDDDDDGDDQ